MAVSKLPDAETISAITKRSNWASRNPGVVLVFCIVFIVGFGIVSLFLYRQWMARKAKKAAVEVEQV
ncbi:uncharacterized protein LDX57_011640 [Aspergillus melleus]|uniref:uncharacterized protein n=1 Tax=Aspergillus melleus TaxID=138277 RepID=UPI001E8E1ED6|nr:uncharacterized protein LDX57_011640 [Aspergillus melleus]KAH8434004.1 hypothetical protein LDX57_011640 [Aspergillus melleus]